MRAYQKERFLNAVCFFAKEHCRRTGRPAFQTYIYKYLSLFDFRVLEEEGQPALGINYKAYEMGPVPQDLYSRKEATSHYEFLKTESALGEPRFVINPLVEPDMDYFSKYEIEVMTQILDEFTKPGIATKDLIRATHDRIPAWKKAWRNRGTKESVPMDYGDTFGVREKSESSERYKIYEALERGSR